MKESNFVKDTMKYVTIMFILVILVDSTQFDIALRKERYSLVNSFINVIGYARNTFKTVKKVW